MQQLKQWWFSLSQSDQRALIGGVSAGGVLLLWFAVWEPLQQQKHSLQQQLQSLQADYQWMQQAAPQIKQLQRGGNQANLNPLSLLSQIDQSLQKSPLNRIDKRISPKNDNRVQLDFEGVDFNQLMAWLAKLQQHAVQVHSLSLSQQDSVGMVKVHLVLVTR